jgi:hypothetical protein
MLRKVEEWQKSGLSISEFARKNGFSKTGFDYWVKKDRKLIDVKPVSFVELSPTVMPRGIATVSSEAQEPEPRQGSIVITFPGGMSVKIYG